MSRKGKRYLAADPTGPDPIVKYKRIGLRRIPVTVVRVRWFHIRRYEVISDDGRR